MQNKISIEYFYQRLLSTILTAICLTVAFSASACGSANIQAESRTANSTEKSPRIEKRTSVKANVSNKKSKTVQTAAAIDGSYNFDSGGEVGKGYHKQFAAGKKGANKLQIYFFITTRTADDVVTSEIAEGGGLLTLNGTRANGKISKAGNTTACNVSNVFSENQATVTASDCGFKVAPDGVYKKEIYVSHVELDKLYEYLNDDPKRPPGEEFVIDTVPEISKILPMDENGKLRDWFILRVPTEEITSKDFFTSLDLVKQLRPHLKPAADHLRVECVLIEIAGGGGVSNEAFAVAVEGVDADYKVLWRVEVAKPKRFKVSF